MGATAPTATATVRTPRWLVPEVVQTSAMDCGPASLKCVLEGFGISASYGRLREACQTDVDGTSIDALEDALNQLGLEAEQRLVPTDHVLLGEAAALPAIVVVRLPNGLTHFVVLWSHHGGLVQLMDPGTGRRWTSARRFLSELYVHGMPVPAEAWRDYAGSDEFVLPLARRLRALGVPRGEGHVERALGDPGWYPLAALDAATRLTEAIVEAGGLSRGRTSARVLGDFLARALAEGPTRDGSIPERYWSASALPDGDDQEPRVLLRGAVLVTVRAPERRAAVPEGPPGARPETGTEGEAEAEAEPPRRALSPELVAALAESPEHPGRRLLALLREDGLLAPAALVGAFALSALGGALEALLFRSVFEVGRYLGLLQQRLAAVGLLGLFLLALALLEFPVAATLQRLGRGLEVRLRVAFLQKIPRLGDRYFQSRPTSDMAERSHAVHSLRTLPGLGARVVRGVMDLGVTTAGIAWLDPESAPLAVLVASLGVALPLLAQPLVTERDLRFRIHGGSLTRFYLDAMQGLVAVRTHGAERAVRRQHEALLVEWARAGRDLQRVAVAVEGVQGLAGVALSAWLLHHYLSREGGASGLLLLLYWALNLPALAQELALSVRQYPMHRNITLRLLEPLGAPEEPALEAAPRARGEGAVQGVSVALEGVTVRAAGHAILEDVSLTLPSGGHVAVVGPSGAGKSSFVGLFLGWHRPASGAVTVDGEPLDAARLAALRAETAWVDPAVQLWNRSFLENLRYGAPEEGPRSLSGVLDQADLRGVLQRLPDGLQTALGEGGALMSGGEGQRVRLARAMLRARARLVILDEPFRGLDRDRRRALMARARALWSRSTLVCITHDVGATLDFERVLVIDGGRVVEDGPPTALAADPGSRFRALLDAEEAVRRGLWTHASWRRLRIEGGRVEERPRGTAPSELDEPDEGAREPTPEEAAE